MPGRKREGRGGGEEGRRKGDYTPIPFKSGRGLKFAGAFWGWNREELWVSCFFGTSETFLMKGSDTGRWEGEPDEAGEEGEEEEEPGVRGG